MRKPFFNAFGDLAIPNDLFPPSKLKDKLTPREYFVYLWEIAEGKELLSKELYDSIYFSMLGSRQTRWRVKTSLKKRGIL